MATDNISYKEHFEKLFAAEKESTRDQFTNVDKRFEQQEKNVEKALVSQKELYQTVQVSSDKAIQKAEEAQPIGQAPAEYRARDQV